MKLFWFITSICLIAAMTTVFYLEEFLINPGSCSVGLQDQ